MYSCPTCGAGLVFDPKTQKLLCLSCRNQYEPEKIEKMRLDTAKEVETQENTENEYEAIAYKCSHCGAELLTTDETITTFCSFCRTGTMLDRKIIKKRKPDYIIPFKLSKEECKNIYIKKIRKSFFAPKNMIETQEVEKIRGIYMPYWVYSFEKHGPINTEGQKYNHISGDYIYYDDYNLSTNVDGSYKGLTHDATSNFYDRLSESIAPFSIKEKKDFSPGYFSGYYADNEDVDEDTYLDENEEIANINLSKILRKKKEYRKYEAYPDMTPMEHNVKLALFPIYFLATKSRRGDRISYAVINGQTGKIAADVPIDFKKFAIFSIILAIPLFILLNMVITISMPILIVCSLLFNIISLLILNSRNKKIDIREQDLDDKGMKNKSIKNGKQEYKKDENQRKNVYKNGILTILMAIFIIAFSYFPHLIKVIPLSVMFKVFGGVVFLITVPAMIIRKLKNPEKDSSIFKPVIGLLITIAVLCLEPVSDIYYYIATLISIVLAIWSFYNIIDRYNIYTTRKLPQLGKRGGDENA